MEVFETDATVHVYRINRTGFTPAIHDWAPQLYASAEYKQGFSPKTQHCYCNEGERSAALTRNTHRLTWNAGLAPGNSGCRLADTGGGATVGAAAIFGEWEVTASTCRNNFQ